MLPVDIAGLQALRAGGDSAREEKREACRCCICCHAVSRTEGVQNAYYLLYFRMGWLPLPADCAFLPHLRSRYPALYLSRVVAVPVLSLVTYSQEELLTFL